MDSAVCECCGSTVDVRLEDSRTAYPYEIPAPTVWDKVLDREPEPPPDPNAPVWLCRECAADHHSLWDERWSEYYAGLL